MPESTGEVRQHQVDILIAHKDLKVITLDRCRHRHQRMTDMHTQVQGDKLPRHGTYSGL